MKGRRRPDTKHGEWPEDAQPGDYWKILAPSGEPLLSEAPSNLTGGVWCVQTPNGLFGNLVNHTVREHEDGTITVAPNDGSSNSILITRSGNPTIEWHGYIDHGVWSSV